MDGTSHIYKKQTICLQNDLLDDWMTRKKTGYICSKLPVGWLDGWMDSTSQTYVKKYLLDDWMTRKKSGYMR